MTIAYVTDAFAIRGGLEQVLATKLSWLADAGGHSVVLVTTCQGHHRQAFPCSPRVQFADLGVPLHHQYRHRWPSRMLVRWRLLRLLTSRLRAVLAGSRADVVVCVRKDLLAATHRAAATRPLIFESHSCRLGETFAGSPWPRRLAEWYYNRQARHARWTVALTPGDAAEWRKLTPRVAVIPDVISLSTGEARPPSDGSDDARPPRAVISVGRFARQKDYDSLLRIWHLVHGRHPDWQLHVYGDEGDDSRRREQLAAMAAEGIAVHPPAGDMAPCYQACALLLLTSLFEPFGLVLPEAMSCGLPVVAFDCPYGPATIVTDGTDGFLVADGTGRSPRADDDIRAFAGRVCLLIEQPALRSAMGRAARQSARRYAADRIMPEWNRLFDDCRPPHVHKP